MPKTLNVLASPIKPSPVPDSLRGRGRGRVSWKFYAADRSHAALLLKPLLRKDRWCLEWCLTQPTGRSEGTLGRLVLEPGPVWLVQATDSHSYFRRVGKGNTLEEAAQLLFAHLLAAEVEAVLTRP